jgi:hypothetical protein
MSTSMAGLRRAALLFVLALVSARAYAQPANVSDDAVARARTHFEAGRALFNLGNYTDAVREFSAGYQLSPRPGFLLNLGQCYRKLNDLPRAREMYQHYLRDASPDDPEVPQARSVLHEIEQYLQEHPEASSPPPPTTTTGPEGTHTGENPPPLSPTTVVAPPPAAHKPWIKRNWWIIPVGVVVVGAAVGVGV